jgi:F-type H+-transporting ATPase subunit b
MDIGMTLLGQAITFALLIAFTAKFIWPPLMAAIEERQQKIAEGLAAADLAKKKEAQAEEQVAELLKEARAKANEIIAQAETRRSQIIDHAKDEAIEEANRQKAAALAEIESAGNRAREDLRKQVGAIAVAGAEKLLRREIDSNAHKALLDELAAEI